MSGNFTQLEMRNRESRPSLSDLVLCQASRRPDRKFSFYRVEINPILKYIRVSAVIALIRQLELQVS